MPNWNFYLVRKLRESSFRRVLLPAWRYYSTRHPRDSAREYLNAVATLVKISESKIRPALDDLFNKCELHPIGSSDSIQGYESLSKSYVDHDLFMPLMAFIYDLVRSMKPKIIVETGVERGASTYTFLRAIAKNGFGELHSVDLKPPIHSQLKLPIAPVVPQSFRENWHYYEGDSRAILPKLLDNLGTVDLFMHGSNHSYEVQSFEVMTAWPHIKEPKVCIVDRPDYPVTNDYRAWNEILARFRPSRTIELPEGDYTLPNQKFGVIFQ